jgi:hypothetical protein
LAGFDDFALNDIVCANDQYVASLLARSDRLIARQQRLVLMRHRHPDAHEETGQQRAILVLEHRAHRQRASRRVELRRGVVEMTFVRIALFVLQADLDWNARNGVQVRTSPQRQNLRLAHREIDIDRIDLDNGCEYGRRASADEIAYVDLMIGDDTVKGGEDSGVAKIDGGGIDVGLIDSNCGLVLFDDEFLVLRLLQCN